MVEWQEKEVLTWYLIQEMHPSNRFSVLSTIDWQACEQTSFSILIQRPSFILIHRIVGILYRFLFFILRTLMLIKLIR